MLQLWSMSGKADIQSRFSQPQSVIGSQVTQQLHCLMITSQHLLKAEREALLVQRG